MDPRQEKIVSLIRDFRRYLYQLQEEGIRSVVAEKSEESRARVSARNKLKEKPPETGKSIPEISRSQAQEELKKLGKKVRDCQMCRLNEARRNAVFGEGGMKKRVMFIGEGPGENEDLQGRPFVGRAGQLLDKILASIGLSRRDVFITNIVKCRPPRNRDPRPDEVIACWPYLEEQIKLLKPRVIVTLGSPAAKTLLDTDEGISKLRGRFHDFEGIPLLPTYHPAYLLRAYTEENRRKVWDDMKKLKQFLEEGKGSD